MATLIQRNAGTDYMNEIQFMEECILQGLDYPQYMNSALACEKRVLTPDNYSDRIESMAAEERYWNEMADEISTC